MEALLTKRAALQQRTADLERKIRDLGSLPADAFEKFRGRPLKDLHRQLQRAQQALKQYGCVRAVCKWVSMPGLQRAQQALKDTDWEALVLNREVHARLGRARSQALKQCVVLSCCRVRRAV